MLKAMFKELQARLNAGDQTFGLFDEFNTQPWRVAEWCKKYDNLGVLYVENGDLRKLPDGALMIISYKLELFMRVEDNFSTASNIVLPLQNIATGTTGVIFTENENSQKVQFVLDTGLPTTDGTLIEGENCYYVRYIMPINVVFAKGIALSDTGSIKIAFPNDDTAYTLQSVISFTEMPQTQVETNVFVNSETINGVTYPAMQNESIIVATGWNAQITKLFRPDDVVDQKLREIIMHNPRAKVKVYTKKYNSDNLADDVYESHDVILHNCIFTNELSQAVYLVINMSTGMREV